MARRSDAQATLPPIHLESLDGPPPFSELPRSELARRQLSLLRLAADLLDETDELSDIDSRWVDRHLQTSTS